EHHVGEGLSAVLVQPAEALFGPFPGYFLGVAVAEPDTRCIVLCGDLDRSGGVIGHEIVLLQCGDGGCDKADDQRPGRGASQGDGDEEPGGPPSQCAFHRKMLSRAWRMGCSIMCLRLSRRRLAARSFLNFAAALRSLSRWLACEVQEASLLNSPMSVEPPVGVAAVLLVPFGGGFLAGVEPGLV